MTHDTEHRAIMHEANLAAARSGRAEEYARFALARGDFANFGRANRLKRQNRQLARLLAARLPVCIF